jgi:high-affinity nickel-transport protein
MSLLPVLSLGFVLGVTHAADADHVAAMSTVVAERRRVGAAAWAGALWGLGHTATVLVLGGAILLTRAAVPERFALALELGVAVMLLALGARTLWRSRRPPEGHAHAGRRSGLQSFGIGFVHGIAGSAGTALAVAAEVEAPSAGLAYLVLFGLGTLAGMVLLTSALAFPVAALGQRLGERARRVATAVAGSASVALGLWLFYRIGFVEGLFAA